MTELAKLLSSSNVPGAAFAIVRNGEIVESGFAGIANASTNRPVAEGTVFQAASLSKPVFAHAILQLIDEGRLSLDLRLAEIVPTWVAGDPRAAEITVAHVLSHTTGLPNWRSDELPLRTYFAPGSRFSYSGEGFLWLQAVSKRITGLGLEQLARRYVFDPLAMKHATFDPKAVNPDVLASSHDAGGLTFATPLPPFTNAAASLHTTAGDYAKFVRAVLGHRHLAPRTTERWMTPRSTPPSSVHEAVDPRSGAPPDPALSWGLGWGLENQGGTFFHWGNTPGFNAIVLGSVAERRAVVVLTNGDNGGRVAAAMVKAHIPGDHPSLRWLGWG